METWLRPLSPFHRRVYQTEDLIFLQIILRDHTKVIYIYACSPLEISHPSPAKLSLLPLHMLCRKYSGNIGYSENKLLPGFLWVSMKGATGNRSEICRYHSHQKKVNVHIQDTFKSHFYEGGMGCGLYWVGPLELCGSWSIHMYKSMMWHLGPIIRREAVGRE